MWRRSDIVCRRNRTWPTSHSSPSFLHLKWCRIWSNEWSTYLPAKTGPSLEIAARRRRINSFWNQFLSSPFGGGLLVGVRRVSESPCKFRGGGLHRLGWFQPLCLARVTIIRIGIPQPHQDLGFYGMRYMLFNALLVWVNGLLTGSNTPRVMDGQLKGIPGETNMTFVGERTT